MNTILQILGSIASIGAIPLAIYLYLRSREARYSKLRHEIVRILSYQIGEGRNLSTFEIRTVIDSKTREARGKQGTIDVNEVVEDLVVETISSPMLNSERKREILLNLGEIHRRGKILAAIDRYRISYRQFLIGIQNTMPLKEEDLSIAESEVPERRAEEPSVRPERRERVSEIFALVGAVVTIIALLVSILGETKLMKSFSAIIENNEQLLKFMLGIAAGLIASIITAFIRKLGIEKRSKSGKKESSKKQENG